MKKKLQVWLPDDWATVENPDGPFTVCWQAPEAAGAFQLSTAEYTGGSEPRPTEADLIEFALAFGEKNAWGEVTSSSSGKCVMGLFGTAAFKRTISMPGDAPEYSQIWLLSNGLDFVFATFIAQEQPGDREIAAAQRIAEGVDFR
jgi:hypothetical protein